MLKNSQKYFKSLAVFTPQDFESMFSHFSTLCMKGLKDKKKLSRRYEGTSAFQTIATELYKQPKKTPKMRNKLYKVCWEIMS